MRKYFYIFKTTLIENLVYITNILLGFISYGIVLFIFLNLWRYVYQDSTSLISGYNISQMIWYVLITELMWFGARNKALTAEIANDIKSGKIAYNINKPYNYVIYIIAKFMGEVVIKFGIYSILSLSFGWLFVGPLTGFKFYNLPLILLVILLGVIINAILRITISLISFWVEENKPFHWLYDKIILVLGTLFPVELFPRFLQPIIKCSPIFVVTYGPAKLVVDFSLPMFYQIIIAQIIYLGISIGLVTIMYTKGVKKLNVNGG